MRAFESSGGFVAATLLAIAFALAQSLEAAERDLVHSDLPIFGHGGENEWPRHFDTEDSCGCSSRVDLGAWVFRETGAKDEDDTPWWYSKYNGVFDCWANIFRGDEPVPSYVDSYKSFFILLDTVEVDGSELELWAVQIGARPGSDYVLLSRSPGKELIANFSVLQTSCPHEQVRDTGNLVCVIDSKDELILLARRMAQRPPLGTITRVAGDAEEARD